MREFDFDDSRAFIHASGIVPFLLAFGTYRSRGEQVMMRHFGVPSLDLGPETKYPLRGFMSAMKELQDQFGPAFLRKMGSHITSNALFPSHLDSTEKVLGSVDMAYRMSHEINGAEIGSYRWTPADERSGTMTCDTPYACAMDLGLLEAVLTRFAPAGSESKSVTHVGEACRGRGADACVYRLEW